MSPHIGAPQLLEGVYRPGRRLAATSPCGGYGRECVAVASHSLDRFRPPVLCPPVGLFVCLSAGSGGVAFSAPVTRLQLTRGGGATFAARLVCRHCRVVIRVESFPLWLRFNSVSSIVTAAASAPPLSRADGVGGLSENGVILDCSSINFTRGGLYATARNGPENNGLSLSFWLCNVKDK